MNMLGGVAKIMAGLCLATLVVLSAGCSGEGFTPAPEPDVVVSHPIPAQLDGDVEIIGSQEWEVRGDLPSRPVELVAVPAEALSLERLAPGQWRLTALSSWQCDVHATIAGQTVWSAHVVTTRVVPEKLSILVSSADDLGGGEWRAWTIGVGVSTPLAVTWIDHGATGYPGWEGTPDVPVLWDVPDGLRLTVVGHKGAEINIVPLRAGTFKLVGDVAGKKFTVWYIVT